MPSTAKPTSISFLGRGLKMSFTAKTGRTAEAEGVEYAIQTLRLIFLTRKYSRPMRRQLGLSVDSIILKPILSSLVAQVTYHLKSSLISYNEERYKIDEVNIDWNKSKGSDIWFVVNMIDKSDGSKFPVSFLWEHIR